MGIFAQRLKVLMEKKEVDEKQLAKETGLYILQIKRYLEACHVPSISIAVKLATCFSCTTDYLLGLSDKENEYWTKHHIKTK